MMLYRLGEIIVLPIVWAALVLGSLQSKLFVSASAHSICGPWGCGPETAALVAMHAGWLAVIGPPLIYFPLRLKWSSAVIRRLSFGLFLAGLAGVLAIVAWQWLVWLPQAGAWSKDYFWQRCGFVVVTAVDWPLIPLLILSGILWSLSYFLTLYLLLKKRVDSVDQPKRNLGVLFGDRSRLVLGDALDDMSDAVEAKGTVACAHSVHHTSQTE